MKVEAKTIDEAIMGALGEIQMELGATCIYFPRQMANIIKAHIRDFLTGKFGEVAKAIFLESDK